MKSDSYENNKYDTYIILLLVSTIFGDIGGAFQVVRVIALLLLPQLVAIKWRSSACIKGVVSLFVTWYLYAVFSFIWTPDKIEAVKELVYYPVHMLMFIEICAFSLRAANPLSSICKGWLWFVLLTSIVGIWEITTDQHLSTSSLQGAAYLIGEGEVVVHHFASVTFRNFNNYVVRLASSIPFIIYLLLDGNKIIRYLSFMAMGAVVYILSMNASRGGIICLAISLIMFLVYSLKNKNKANIISLFVMIFSATALIYVYWDFLSQNIMIRTQSAGMLEDDSRSNLLIDGINLVFNDYLGLGAGIGGGFTAMENMRHNGLSATHNLFLEIFVYFGIIITILIIMALFKMYRLGVKIKDEKRKMIIMITLFIMLPYAIIDSGYLLSPQTWLYFASIFVFVYYSSLQKNFLKNSSI